MRSMSDSEAARADEIKSCFAFRVLSSPFGYRAHKPLRDPYGLCLLEHVGERLRTAGFQVTPAKPGKACDAGFYVRFTTFDVAVILLVKRRVGEVECGLLTSCVRPAWCRESVEATFAEWARVCKAIYHILQQDSEITALAWVTGKEFNRVA